MTTPIRTETTIKVVKLYSTLGSSTFQFLSTGRVYVREGMFDMSTRAANKQIRELRQLGWSEEDPCAPFKMKMVDLAATKLGDATHKLVLDGFGAHLEFSPLTD